MEIIKKIPQRLLIFHVSDIKKKIMEHPESWHALEHALPTIRAFVVHEDWIKEELRVLLEAPDCQASDVLKVISDQNFDAELIEERIVIKKSFMGFSRTQF